MAAIETVVYDRWRRNGLLPDRSSVERLDVVTAALIAEFARRGIEENALKDVSRLIYDGADVAAKHDIATSSIPAIAFHGTLRVAEEDGRFGEVAATIGDASARLFSNYPDYLSWCRACGTAPTEQEEAAIAMLEPDDLAFLPNYYDLVAEDTPADWSVVWDIVMCDEVPLVHSRRSTAPPPREIWSGEEAVSWVSVSVTALHREIQRRATAMPS